MLKIAESYESLARQLEMEAGSGDEACNLRAVRVAGRGRAHAKFVVGSTALAYVGIRKSRAFRPGSASRIDQSWRQSRRLGPRNQS